MSTKDIDQPLQPHRLSPGVSDLKLCPLWPASNYDPQEHMCHSLPTAPSAWPRSPVTWGTPERLPWVGAVAY